MSQTYPFKGDKKQLQDDVQILPKGKYRLKVVYVKVGESKSGRVMFRLKFAPVKEKGNYGIWDIITLIPEDADGHGITVHKLKQLGMPYDGQVSINPDNFMDKVINADVFIDNYNGKESNKISTVHSDDLNQPVGSEEDDDNSIPF